MTIRTQILLEKEEHEALKALAQQRGRSISQVAREAIRKEIEQERSRRDALRRRFLDAAGCGLEPDEATDVARHHDAYLHGDQG